MILGETPTAASTAATLDDLFRRAGVRHPDALALADPPNRQNFTDGIPRALSFAQADRAISAIAARLRGLGLQTDSAVAIQLPNIVESIVAFLGVLRAGMIALPLPLLWRQEEIVSALRQVGVKAIRRIPVPIAFSRPARNRCAGGWTGAFLFPAWIVSAPRRRNHLQRSHRQARCAIRS